MLTLFDELKELLKKDTRLTAEGELLKNQVTELVFKLDRDLLKLLLSNKHIKGHFFEDVDGVFVFDKENFTRFVNNKEFLPDSYTTFKNKIGLTTGDNYLSENKDVVLSWAYKDTVLEGGQTKEDAKRDEIFWNEILAPDEINRLLAPKVFSNWKRYEGKTEKKQKNKSFRFQSTDNLIIKGNNLLALYSLKKRFAGKVKLIYIDPPYNLGDDSFGYNDRFNHSSWLTFMKNRLEVAKDLMKVDGLIFIQIGDQEMHYLKVMADAIFERDNFIATVPRKTRSGKSDVPYQLSQDFDWILIYTKGASKKDDLFQRTVTRKYYKTKDYPNDEWRLTDLTTQRTIIERPNSNFTLVNPRNGQKFPVNPNRCWGVTKDSVDEYLKRGKIVFPGDYEFLDMERPAMRVFKSEEIRWKGDNFDKSYVSSDFLNQAMDDLLKNTVNKKGTDEIVELFGNKVFAYPKNELLLQRIIEYTTEKDDLVLDFHVGSGTTAAVAHKMGRQYIGIEQMDYIESITVERLKKVIEGEQGGISELVNWDGGGSFVYCELMVWNERFLQQVQKAKKKEDLQAIWKDMQAKAHISYKVHPDNFKENVKEFDELSLEDQKRFLMEVLDKNALYVNLSEIDDKTYGVSEDDKRLNREFYGS